MAKFTPSQAGDIRGSMGGVTFSKNRNGNYIRRRVAGVNPRTPAQTAIRETFSALSSLWRGLTEPQRAAWNTWAATFPLTNSLGQTYFATGQQAFVGLNTTRNLLELGAILVPPPPAVAPNLLTLTVTATGDDTAPVLTAAFTPTPLGVGSYLAVYATGPYSAGRSFVRSSDFRLIFKSTASPTSPLNLRAGWESVFGPLSGSTEGLKLALRVRVIAPDFRLYPGLEKAVIIAGA